MNETQTVRQILIYESGVGRGGSRRTLLMLIELMQQWPDISPLILCGTEGWFSKQLSARHIPYQMLPEPHALLAITNSVLYKRIQLLGLISRAILDLIPIWYRLRTIQIDGILLTHPRDFIVLFPLVLKHRFSTATFPQSMGYTKIPFGKIMCQLVSQTFAISDMVAADIVQVGIKSSKVQTLPLIYVSDSGDDQPTRQAIRQQLGLPDEAKVMGLVGSIRKLKGQREAVEALAFIKSSIPDTYLVIVGEPLLGYPDEKIYYEALQAQMQELSLTNSVLFLGWREDARQIMRAFDLLLMPSYSEGIPRVLLEALEAGIPIVGSDIPTFREVIASNKVGYLAPIGDSAVLAQLALSILSDPDQQRQLSIRAREIWKQHFSAEVANPIIHDAFIDLLKGYRNCKQR